MSPVLKICETRELLAEQYRMAPAPDPSRELLVWMNIRPLIAARETGRDDVLVPLAPRRAHRLRYLVAATVASTFAMSGLAAAGALPALAAAGRGVGGVGDRHRSARARCDPDARRSRPAGTACTRRPADSSDCGPSLTARRRRPAPVAPDAEPGTSGVDPIPDQTVPPLSDLPVVELPALPLPAPQPPPVMPLLDRLLPSRTLRPRPTSLPVGRVSSGIAAVVNAQCTAWVVAGSDRNVSVSPLRAWMPFDFR